jgi:hypothetical protein
MKMGRLGVLRLFVLFRGCYLVRGSGAPHFFESYHMRLVALCAFLFYHFEQRASSSIRSTVCYCRLLVAGCRAYCVVDVVAVSTLKPTESHPLHNHQSLDFYFRGGPL